MSLLWSEDTRALFDELKDVFLFELDFEFTQQCQIFILERPSTMMLFLILYIAGDRV